MGGNPHGGKSREFHFRLNAKSNVYKTITKSAGSESGKHSHDREKPYKDFWG